MRTTETDEKEMPIVDRIELRDRTGAYCPVCEELVELVPSEEVASTIQINADRAEELAKAGFIHRLHNKNGKVMFCKNSLLQHFNGRRSITFNLKALNTQATASTINGE